MSTGPSLSDTLLAQRTLAAAELATGSVGIRRASPALAALVGRTPAQLVGAAFTEFVPPTEREAVRAFLVEPEQPAPLAGLLLVHDTTPRPVTFSRTTIEAAGDRPPTTLLLAELLPFTAPLATPPPEVAAAHQEHGNIFRHIVLSANEGIWTVDAHGRTTFVNQRMHEMLGYSVEEMRGHPITEFLPADELADHAAQIERRRQGLADRYERRFLRKDGTVLWTQVAGTPLTGPGGEYHGSFGLFSDITDRKRADRALQLSEERYRSLLGAATDYVFTVPYHEGIPSATIHGPGCVKVTGYEPHEYAADPFLWYRMIAPEDRGAVERHIRQATEGDRADAIEHRLLHRDGTIRWVRNTLVPRRDPSGRLIAIDGLVTDITERTLAVQQLRERETLYRAVIETTADGFWITDLAGRILEVNDAYVRTSGYSRAELLALHVFDLDAGESAAEAAAHIARVRRDGCDLFETRHRTKDGTVWQAEINVTYWPIGDGRLFVFIRDIHRRKRSESLLRARLHFSDLTRQGGIEAILRAAADTAELHTGSALGFFHFLEPDPAAGVLRTWSTRTPPAPPVAAGDHGGPPLPTTDTWSECLRTRAPVVRNSLPAPTPGTESGPGYPTLVRELAIPVLRNDRIVAIVGVGNKTTDYTADDVDSVQQLADVAMDFVQRLRAEQSLRRSEHQLRLIIDSVPALIAYVDTALRYRLLNEAYRHWFSEPISSILGRTVAEQVGAEAWAAVAPLFARALAGETVVFEQQLALREAGSRWVHGFYTPDHGPDGQVRGLVIHVNDISNQKQLESQLLRAQRLEVVGRLASGVAHDLNNILQPVLMAPRLLRPAITDPEALGLVDTIEGSVRRGAEIIKQLLAFGRGTEVRRVPLRLEALIVDLTRILRETLPKNILLRCELPPHAHPVMADATQLHQVLMNLCLNARDAMRSGGTLTLRLERAEYAHPPADAIPHGRCGRFQVVTVADTGTGIAPEHLPKLFDPFFTTKDVGEGTGLGLPTVLGIVRSHEGFIKVASVPGAGSVFRVFLPESDTPAPPPPVRQSPSGSLPAEMRHRHILIVDDEPSVRDLLRQTLVGAGFQVSEAANGAEALVILAQRENAIDLVVADLLMPVMDGTVLIRELHRRRPGLPIVAMSGHLGNAGIDSAVRPAIRALLPKPFDAAQLLATLRAALPA